MTKAGSTVIDVSVHLRRALVGCDELKRLWHRPYISLKLKHRVHRAATFSSVILLHRKRSSFGVFDHQCLHNIARIGLSDCVSHVNVRNRVLSTGSKKILSQCIQPSRLSPYEEQTSIVSCRVEFER